MNLEIMNPLFEKLTWCLKHWCALCGVGYFDIFTELIPLSCSYLAQIEDKRSAEAHGLGQFEFGL